MSDNAYRFEVGPAFAAGVGTRLAPITLLASGRIVPSQSWFAGIVAMRDVHRRVAVGLGVGAMNRVMRVDDIRREKTGAGAVARVGLRFSQLELTFELLSPVVDGNSVQLGHVGDLGAHGVRSFEAALTLGFRN